MLYLIDYQIVEQQSQRQSPTSEQKNALKDFIKSLVISSGGILANSDVCKACFEQFPDTFTWGEIEDACQQVQYSWNIEKANNQNL